MAFKAAKGKWGLRWYPKKASTAFTINALVQYDGSGAVEPSTTSSLDNVGIIRKTIASTDSDYASTTLVPVEVPLSPTCEVEFDVGTGTLTAADVGLYIDLASSTAADQSASAHDIILVTKFISASKGLGILNGLAPNKPAV